MWYELGMKFSKKEIDSIFREMDKAVKHNASSKELENILGKTIGYSSKESGDYQ